MQDTESTLQRRGMASVLLGKIGDRRAVAPLMRIVQEDRESGLALNAIVLLGQIGDDRAVPVLMEAITTQKHTISHAVFGALTALGGRRMENALIEFLTHSSDQRLLRVASIILSEISDHRILDIVHDNPSIPADLQTSLINKYLEEQDNSRPNEIADIAVLVEKASASRKHVRPRRRGQAKEGPIKTGRPGHGGEFRETLVVPNTPEGRNGWRVDQHATARLPNAGQVVVRVNEESAQVPPITVIASSSAFNAGWGNTAIAITTLASLNLRKGKKGIVKLVVGDQSHLGRGCPKNTVQVAKNVLEDAGISEENRTSALETLKLGIARGQFPRLSRGQGRQTVFVVSNFYEEDLTKLQSRISLLDGYGYDVVPVQIGDTATFPSTVVEFGNNSFRVPPSIEMIVRHAGSKDLHDRVEAFLSNNHGVVVPINDVSSSKDLPGRIMKELLGPSSRRDYGETPHIEIDEGRDDRSVAIAETEPPQHIVELFQDALNQSVQGNVLPLDELVRAAKTMGWSFVLDLLRSEMRKVDMNLHQINTEVDTSFVRAAKKFLNQDPSQAREEIFHVASSALEIKDSSPQQKLWWSTVLQTLNDEGVLFGLPRFMEAGFWGPSESTLSEFIERRNARLLNEQTRRPSTRIEPTSVPNLVRNEENRTPADSGVDRLDLNHQLMMTFDHPELLIDGAIYFAQSITAGRNPATLGCDVVSGLSLEYFLGNGDGLRVRGALARGVNLDEHTTPVPLNGRAVRHGGIFRKYIDYKVAAGPVESPVLKIIVSDLREQGAEIYGDQYTTLTDAVPIDGLPQYMQDEINQVVASVENLSVEQAIAVIQRYVLSRFRYEKYTSKLERDQLEEVRQISAARQGHGHEYLKLIYRLRHGTCAELTEVTMTLLRMAGIPTARFNGLVAKNGQLDSEGHAVSIVVVPMSGESGRWQAIPVETSITYASDEDLTDLNLRRIENGDGERAEPATEETSETLEQDSAEEKVIKDNGNDELEPDQTVAAKIAEIMAAAETELDPLTVIETELEQWWRIASSEQRLRMNAAFDSLMRRILYKQNMFPENYRALVAEWQGYVQPLVTTPSFWMGLLRQVVEQRWSHPVDAVSTEEIITLVNSLPEIMTQPLGKEGLGEI